MKENDICSPNYEFKKQTKAKMSETASSLLHEGKKNGNKPPEQKWHPTEKTPGQIESPGRRVRDMSRAPGADPLRRAKRRTASAVVRDR